MSQSTPLLDPPLELRETTSPPANDPDLSLALKLGMEPLSELPRPELPPDLAARFSLKQLKRNLLLPLRVEEDLLICALADPLNIEALEEARFLSQMTIKPYYSPRAQILDAIEWLYRQQNATASALVAGLQIDSSSRSTAQKEGYDLLEEEATEGGVIALINRIFVEAIEERASDIHFEPLEHDLRVRFRIDGVLIKRYTLPRQYQAQLLARLKVMAALDIAEHRLPQDGRVKLQLGSRDIDLRVSTLPVAHGERIVLRLLDRSNLLLGLDQIGCTPDTLRLLRKLLTLSEGILLVTGPTGSGKTTTLYSALSEIANDELNIMTVEDPIEYKLPGIAQIGVRPQIGLTFSAGLRHILRQDPDVIMVGEIRDRETAEMAIQSALTGHLVLSTLHTNDAPSAITRLIDMGIEPYLISSSLVGVLAQRLVRLLCLECRGEGCEGCAGIGFRSRRGIYELMALTPALQQQMIERGDANALRKIALREGMVPLSDRGQQLVEQGLTTQAEVLRVTRTLEEL